jgi:hypothetical protein
MSTKQLDFGDFEFEETDDALILALPAGHGYTDIQTFFYDVFDILNNGDWRANAYEYSYLFIDTFDNIYNGARACNCGVWNAIIDLYERGYTTLHAVDHEDIEEIRADWFE